jgi:hypothetical protein
MEAAIVLRISKVIAYFKSEFTEKRSFASDNFTRIFTHFRDKMEICRISLFENANSTIRKEET